MNDKQLRTKLIRLAHQNPAVRKDVLPLLTKQAAGEYDYNALLNSAAQTFHKAVVEQVNARLQKIGRLPMLRETGMTAVWEILVGNTIVSVKITEVGGGAENRAYELFVFDESKGKMLVSKESFGWKMMNSTRIGNSIFVKISAALVKAGIL